MKKKLPSATQIKKVLSGCAFDPRAEGPMHIIATTAGRNYHEVRAVELIRDAADSLELNGNGEVDTYCEKIRMAIGLLALAMTEAPVATEQ